MKKRYLLGLFFGCMILICMLVLVKGKQKSALYEKYAWAEAFYGKKLYAEIDYKSTKEERLIGETIRTQMEEVLSYTGNPETAKEVGELQQFYWFHQGIGKPVSQTCKVNLLTTKIEKHKGHIWVDYTVTRYDEDDKVINYTGNGPTLLYIEKIGKNWVVIDKEEPA